MIKNSSPTPHNENTDGGHSIAEFNIKNLFGGLLVKLDGKNGRPSGLTVIIASCIISKDFRNYFSDSFSVFDTEEFKIFLNYAKDLCYKENENNVENYIDSLHIFLQLFDDEYLYNFKKVSIFENNLNGVRNFLLCLYKNKLTKNLKNFPIFKDGNSHHDYFIISSYSYMFEYDNNILSDYINERLENIEGISQYLYIDWNFDKSTNLYDFKNINVKGNKYILKYGFFKFAIDVYVFTLFKDNDLIAYNIKGEIVPDFFNNYEYISDYRGSCFLIYELE